MSFKKIAAVAIILLVGGISAKVLIDKAPAPKKKTAEKIVPLVEVTPLEAGVYRASWQAGGNVNAKPSVKLMAQVTGQVISIHKQAAPGAMLKKGDVLGQVDDSNYR